MVVAFFGVNITEDVNAKFIVTVLGRISNLINNVVFMNQTVDMIF